MLIERLFLEGSKEQLLKDKEVILGSGIKPIEINEQYDNGYLVFHYTKEDFKKISKMIERENVY